MENIHSSAAGGGPNHPQCMDKKTPVLIVKAQFNRQRRL